MIEKPTSQGMARPCFGKLGVIKLTASRRQFSPISLKRGGKQAKLPDPLWDEGHYRIGFRRPSQDMENQALASCLKKTSNTAELKRKPSWVKKFAQRMATFYLSLLRDKFSMRGILNSKLPGAGRRVNLERSRMRRAID
jgi:hypothetical protein